MSRVYALIFDGYADWELGHVLAEIRRFASIEVLTVGFTDQTVTSMGGLRVIPDAVVSDMDIQDVLIFIMPGGEMWKGRYPQDAIEKILHALDDARIPVAAICGATFELARAGLLNGRKHTSNALSDLTQTVPDYSDSTNYVDALATTDGHIITASGLGSIEFTMEIFKVLDLVAPDLMAIWYAAFKHGKHPKSAE